MIGNGFKLPRMNKFIKAVLLTALFVGTTDIISAFLTVLVKTGKFAPQMFNYIAGGALGLDTAMQGGNAAAFLGLFFHYFISFAFTLFFFWAFGSPHYPSGPLPSPILLSAG